MLAPGLVVAFGVILVSVGPSAFLSGLGADHSGKRVGHQVAKLECLHQVGIPDKAAVGDLQVAHLLSHRCHLFHALAKRLVRPEDSGVALHRLLHLESQFSSGRGAIGMT